MTRGRPVGDPGAGDPVGLGLRGVVDAQVLADEVVGLVHLDPVGVGVDRQRRGVHALGDPQLAHDVEDVAGAVDVGRPRGVAVIDSDLVPAGDVEDPVHPTHRPHQRSPVGHVTADHLDSLIHEVAGPARVPHGGDDVIAALDELAHDHAPDEPGRPGHEVPHGRDRRAAAAPETARERLVAPQTPATGSPHTNPSFSAPLSAKSWTVHSKPPGCPAGERPEGRFRLRDRSPPGVPRCNGRFLAHLVHTGQRWAPDRLRTLRAVGSMGP